MKKRISLMIAIVMIFCLSIPSVFAVELQKDEIQNEEAEIKMVLEEDEQETVYNAKKAEKDKQEIQKSEGVEKPEDAGKPEGAGRPEHAGRPEKVSQIKKQIEQHKREIKQQGELVRELARARKELGIHNNPIFINGKEIETDVPPVIKEGRTLIPVRAVTNALGADVDWDSETNIVTVTKAVYGTEIIEIIFKLEEGTVFVNGEEATIDVPSQVINNRTIVPLRFIAETFQKYVEWDQESQTVIIMDADEEDEDEADKIEEDKAAEDEADKIEGDKAAEDEADISEGDKEDGDKADINEEDTDEADGTNEDKSYKNED